MYKHFKNKKEKDKDETVSMYLKEWRKKDIQTSQQKR